MQEDAKGVWIFKLPLRATPCRSQEQVSAPLLAGAVGRTLAGGHLSSHLGTGREDVEV